MKKLLFGAPALPTRLADAALLLFRLHLGLSIAIGAGWGKLGSLYTATEASKLAGATPAPPDWFVQQVAGLGFTFPSPYVWAWLACWGELVGGLLLALGLLTRLSAAQLAFQFFVVAFLWYDSPEPILGMYYQQLLFWGFALLAATGPGRYSLDYWLTHRRPAVVPAAAGRLAGTASLVLLISVAAQAQEQAPRLRLSELRGLTQQWEQGSLTYRDYRTSNEVMLRTSLTVLQASPDRIVLNFLYTEPNGQQVKGADTLQVGADGRRVVWDGLPMQLASKTRLPDGSLRLVLNGSGTDDNRSCRIRRTVLLGPRLLSVVKEVRPDDAPAFFVRNTYAFRR